MSLGEGSLIEVVWCNFVALKACIFVAHGRLESKIHNNQQERGANKVHQGIGKSPKLSYNCCAQCMLVLFSLSFHLGNVQFKAFH